MELDDLKNEWLARDQRLERLLVLNVSGLREASLDRLAREMDRRSATGWFYWLTFLVTVVLLGAFLARNLDSVRFVVPAVLLMVWVLAMHVSTLLERDALRGIDFGAPVLVVQAHLERLKQRRLRAFRWAMLTGQIVWFVPFMIVLFKGLLDVDLYTVSEAMPRVMAINLLAGLAFIPIAIWTSGRIARRFRDSVYLQRVLDSLAGRDLQYSLSFVRRLEDFNAG